MKVWLPFDDAEEQMGGLPDGLEADVWDGRSEPPPDASDVELFVPAYLAGTRPFEEIARMPRLRVVQTLTAGVDDIRSYIPDGVTLCNAKGVHDASTAELAVTLALASLRGVPDFVRAQDEQRWSRPGRRPSLADRRVMVLGYGAVGRAVAGRLAAFEAEVVPVARSARDGVHGFDELPDLLGDVDVVVVVVPMTDETRGMVDAAFLSRLRDGALLVNVARGPVVETDALLAELTSGRLTAALDVTDPEPLPDGHPLWSAPGLLVSPHVGGNSTAFLPRAYRMLSAQLRRFASDEPLENVVTGDY